MLPAKGWDGGPLSLSESRIYFTLLYLPARIRGRPPPPPPPARPSFAYSPFPDLAISRSLRGVCPQHALRLYHTTGRRRPHCTRRLRPGARSPFLAISRRCERWRGSRALARAFTPARRRPRRRASSARRPAACSRRHLGGNTVLTRWLHGGYTVVARWLHGGCTAACSRRQLREKKTRGEKECPPP